MTGGHTWYSRPSSGSPEPGDIVIAWPHYLKTSWPTRLASWRMGGPTVCSEPDRAVDDDTEILVPAVRWPTESELAAYRLTQGSSRE